MNKIETAKRMYAAAVAHDWPAMEKYLHPDFAVIESEGTPFGGRHEGAAGFIKLERRVFRHFARLTVEPTHFMEGDGHVVAIVAVRGIGKKTGKAFDSTMLELIRFEDDRIVEIKPYYWDQRLLEEA